MTKNKKKTIKKSNYYFYIHQYHIVILFILDFKNESKKKRIKINKLHHNYNLKSIIFNYKLRNKKKKQKRIFN